MNEFKAYNKIPCWSNEKIVISEKIDGSNAQIYIDDSGNIKAGSRNRWIDTSSDNFGFAKYVEQNAEELKKIGKGRFYGEWWGQGIQRGYELTEKRFTLFYRKGVDYLPDFVRFAPILYKGEYSEQAIADTMADLKTNGSRAAPGYMNPEGIIIQFYNSDGIYKKTFELDKGKWSFPSEETKEEWKNLPQGNYA